MRSFYAIFLACALFSSNLFSQTPLPVDQDTIALWNFDSDIGDTVSDSGPNMLNGTAIETFRFPMNGAPSTFNEARFFKDHRSYIDLGVLQPHSPLDLASLPEWSVEFLINIFRSNDARTVFDNGIVSIQIFNSRIGVFIKRNGVEHGLTTPFDIPQGIANRIAVVFKNGDLGILVNGQTWASTTIDYRKKINKKLSSYLQPIRIGGTPREKITDFKIGRFHSCLSNETGDIQCWGYNEYGQLGDGTSGNISIVPTKVEGLKDASKLSIGSFFTCALSAGKTYCWGVNDENNLGLPGLFMSKKPLEITGASGATDIESGNYHTCIITAGKTLKCWGINTQGQLGLGFISQNALPTELPGLQNIKQISMGRDHSCAVDEGGQVYCWGWNSKGQLGQPISVTNSSIPQPVSGLSNALKVVTGDQHTCALLSSNEVKCWGFNSFGQLGNGTSSDSHLPVTVSGLANGQIVDLDSGNGDHSCAQLRTDEYNATLRCWGRNDRNQIGQQNLQSNFSTAVQSTGYGQIEKISVGGRTNCFHNNVNVLYCFGSNAFGMLGNGSIAASSPFSSTVLSTRQGFIPGHLDDIRISSVSRFSLVRPTLSLISPIGTSLETNPLIAIGITSANPINNNLTQAKLNGSAVSGLTRNGNLLSGQLNLPLIAGENVLEVSIQDTRGNIGLFKTILKYSPQLDPTKPVKVATSGLTSCYVTGEGYVWCWGSNQSGQLGVDNIRHSSTPIKNRYLKNIESISIASNALCAVDRDRNVSCWGDNFKGQLGSEDYDRRKRSFPVKVNLTKPFIKIVAGVDIFCAVNTDSTLTCWGDTPFNMLGNTFYNYRPTQHPTLSNVKDIAFGLYHTCIIKNDNSVWCGGHNSGGQLGLGTFSERENLTPVVGITGAKQLSLARDNSCVTTYSNQTYCWGANGSFQIGAGSTHTTYGNPLPVLVTIAPDAKTIHGGERSVCTVNFDDSLTCWGQNSHGEIGNSNYNLVKDGYTHTNLALLDFSMSISTACALTVNQEVLCWGSNLIGQSGTPINTKYVNVPTEVLPHTSIFQDLSSLVAGQVNTCMKMNGETHCWGNNEQAQLGFPTDNFAEFYPAKLTGLENVSHTSIGYTLICHVIPSGQAVCSGINTFGQAGVNPQVTQRVNVPQIISGLSNVYKVEAGLDSACAVKNDGTVWCWGNNTEGQLGNGNYLPTHLPQQVIGLTNVVEVSLAMRGSHACARTNENNVYCWGSNPNGQLGTISVPKSNVPLQVARFINSSSISLGANFTCSLSLDKKVVCIGLNNYGQLGIGSNLANANFEEVSLSNPISTLKAGEHHVCALDESKTVLCWGRNNGGQLGNGLNEDSKYPVTVIKNIDELASGAAHSCVISQTNKLACWGFNGSGQFGNGNSNNQNLPTFSDVTKK